MSWLRRLIGRTDPPLPEGPSPSETVSDLVGAPAHDVARLAASVAASLGWQWRPVGTLADAHGSIVVFRELDSGRTQQICLSHHSDFASQRSEIEREIRKAMVLREGEKP